MREISRRAAIGTVGAALGATALGSSVGLAQGRVVRNGRLKQSVSRWPYRDIPLRTFCEAVAEMGLPAIDLLEEDEWDIVAEYGLVCSMGYGGGGTIENGLNVRANHDELVANLQQAMPRAVERNVPNLITFFGNRRGMGDPEAIRNCVDGLRRLGPAAEEHGVTICVELLNSKIDHPDYQGDRTPFGAEIIRRVDSPRVKLLNDIYHMQIMEGDIIRTIRDYAEDIAHYHTGGVPGRNELDENQELQWPAICRAIVETGFTGYVAHEFVPTRDPLTSLREAVALCDV
ncbi:MAG: hydroxypyruvate isomerase [Acidobacteria bacterium]|nr:hydroxypyruvate isomerase [Acidobacteriota bacterium]MBF86177.1 hydroxypyruvate isomerase [Acidobacteriota bacterium]MCH2278251.1 TIM barrel protein [Vicinamibacterales bacterium]MEC7769053.1 TIM barrel protein [Acidobacteriota bacterium]|tara:strand:+ start:2511 stop:3374 length:864 start_codon:yes stop_codon:yes gene_type:complete